MPIDALAPTIDDRRYADIVTELRTRIPRYTPEWTDLNDSDPGITLIQLFAWLSDILLYRLGRVPDNNYIKFLELLGIELQPATAARAEITFPVLANSPETSVIVPLHTQVSATADDGGAPVIFETDRALVALKAPLRSVQAFSGYHYTLLSDLNDPTDLPGDARFLPFGELAGEGTALLLGFDSTEPLPQADLDMMFFVKDRPSVAVTCDADLPATAFFPPATLDWEYWTGTEWPGLTLVKDDTHALTRSGHVILRLPPAGTVPSTRIGEVSDQRFWIRARVASGGYESPPILDAIRTNTISATQAETRQDESLGGSDGAPNQAFTLANTPVLAGTLQLEVDEGDGFKRWTEVSDFFGSGKDDAHFVLNRTSGAVTFGDGVHGRIPVANPQNIGDSIVARTYRYGGGTRGNVPAGALNTALTRITGIDEAVIHNLRAADSGRDEEALSAARQRARQSLQSKCRAVTLQDFELLATQAANVKRAVALPLSHPDFPGTPIPGVVTIVVVPDTADPNPLPSEGTLRTVCAYLNQRRLLTTEVYVVKPTYWQVAIDAEVVAENDADLADLKMEIENDLLGYFHPLRGGEQGDGWPFGGDIFYSRVFNRIFRRGVQRVDQLVISVNGEATGVCQDVDVSEGVLLYSTGHNIRPRYSYEI